MSLPSSQVVRDYPHHNSCKYHQTTPYSDDWLPKVRVFYKPRFGYKHHYDNTQPSFSRTLYPPTYNQSITHAHLYLSSHQFLRIEQCNPTY
uniref:Uncharacterized protein n=1 Tax=uncultured marine virus TaxID=186617 RepID=A0A0F7L481_9VIRU|nr:hypothetical protein MTPG_00031 [uncultured marine virus]